MTSKDPSSEILVKIENISALIQHLRTAIGACEVDDGIYALRLLQALEQTLSGLSRHY